MLTPPAKSSPSRLAAVLLCAAASALASAQQLPAPTEAAANSPLSVSPTTDKAPVTGVPLTSEPVTADPVIAEPVTADPVTSGPLPPPSTRPSEPTPQPTAEPATASDSATHSDSMTASGSTPAGVVPQDSATGSAVAASATSATPPTTNPSTPIRRQTPAAQASSAEAAASTSLLGGTSDIVRLVGALGMVLALIFAAQWAGKRLLGQQRGGRSSRVINVLSRTILAPRQQVILVSVGRRLLVIGDSAGRLTPLAEITDLEEVAELLAESRGEKAAASGAFNEWMNKNQRNFLADDEIDELTPAAQSSAAESLENAQIRDLSQVSDLSPAKVGDLAGLLEKVRGVKRSFKS